MGASRRGARVRAQPRSNDLRHRLFLQAAERVTDDLNPQAREMADESMVRNLAAQADAIWPQEQRLFDRYALSPDARVLDGGCGTGEISIRLAHRYPGISVLGADIIDEHL